MKRSKWLAIGATVLSFIFSIVSDSISEKDNEEVMDRLIDKKVNAYMARKNIEAKATSPESKNNVT